MAYRYGGFGQRNLLKWAEDESVKKGYGDGVLRIQDETLPATYTMATLPFAATERSASLPGLLHIASYKLRENEDPFAEPEYDEGIPRPRLTLVSDRTQRFTLQEETQRRTVTGPTSYFGEQENGLSLGAQSYVLPVAWAGVGAMLTDTRFLKERYRLSARDIADFIADPNTPIWDGVLQGYFSISKISEYTSMRSVEVEMLRLHPSFFVAPVAGGAGQEWYAQEFYTQSANREFY